MLLTVGELREHLETDLPDEALLRIVTAEEAEIIRRYGAHATAAETLPGNGEWLILERTATSITTVTEIDADVTTVLAANDYRLCQGRQMERLHTGANPRSFWAPLVTVAYVPVDMTAQRKLALVQLATLAAKYTAMKSESVGGGDYSGTSLDYTIERERLLRSLAGRSFWLA